MASSGRQGVAFIGCGRIGLVHLTNAVLQRRLEVLWVVEAEGFLDKTRKLIQEKSLGEEIKVTSNLQDVLSDDRVTGVVVSTPTPFHEDACIAASKAGKSIFCEKPLSTDISSIRRMYDAAEGAGKPFFCAFSRRFDPQLRRLHDLVRDGKVGKLRMLKSLSRDPEGMSTKQYLLKAGGTFIDAAVHDIDQLLWIAGDKPEWVFAAGHATHQMFQECNDTDTSCALIKFAGGAIGHVEMSRECPTGYDQRVEVMGTGGVLTSENQQDTYLKYHRLEGTMEDPITNDFIKRYSTAYEQEMHHFADILEDKCEPYVTRQEAEAVHIMCLLCNKSLKSGEKVNFTTDV